MGHQPADLPLNFRGQECHTFNIMKKGEEKKRKWACMRRPLREAVDQTSDDPSSELLQLLSLRIYCWSVPCWSRKIDGVQRLQLWPLLSAPLSVCRTMSSPLFSMAGPFLPSCPVHPCPPDLSLYSNLHSTIPFVFGISSPSMSKLLLHCLLPAIDIIFITTQDLIAPLRMETLATVTIKRKWKPWPL